MTDDLRMSYLGSCRIKKDSILYVKYAGVQCIINANMLWILWYSVYYCWHDIIKHLCPSQGQWSSQFQKNMYVPHTHTLYCAK